MAEETRERLIQVAERLFAERGLHGVSLREIGTAAGQRNNFVNQYHFGSKQGLVDAIFDYRMRPINDRRMVLFRELERSGHDRDLRSLLEALVLPLAEVLQPGSYYARFQAQIWSDPLQARLISMQLSQMQGVKLVSVRIEICARGLPPALRRQRLLLAAKLMVLAFAEHERDLEVRRVPLTPLNILVSDLLDMMVGIINAPVSLETRRELLAAARRRA